MCYKTILWFVILVNFTPLNAQKNYSNFKVNFNVDEHVLDQSDKETLNNLIEEAKRAGYYEITLTAHTDNDGSNGYNLQLSNKRATTVKNYLISNGLIARVMDVEWYGENNPEASNLNSEGKSINRRVVIDLKKYDLNSTEDVLQTAGGNYTQKFILNSKIVNVITAKNGTTFHLPKDALITKDGKAIDAENVSLEIQEFQTAHDAIFNQLSTTCNGKILESGGMFNIVAKYNNEELQLKEGKTIEIEMPSSNIKSDMQIFTGVKNEQGITEWKTTSGSFDVISKNKAAEPSVKLNSKYLESLKHPVNISKHERIDKKYMLPRTKVKPQLPRKPRLSPYRSDKEYFTKFERVMMSKSKRERILAKENERIDKRNQKRLDRYTKNMASYNTLMIRYPGDSIVYLTHQEKFYDWAGMQLKKCRNQINEYEKLAFNRTISKLILANDGNQIKNPLSIGLLTNNNMYDDAEKETLLELFRIEYQLQHVLALEYPDMVKDYAVNGVFDLDRKCSDRRRSITNQDFTYRMNTNSFAAEYYKSNRELKAVFAEANLELLSKRNKLGMTDMNALNSIYSASITGFGSINCDRFSNSPAMVDVKIECNESNQVSFFLPSINSYIFASKDSHSNTFHVRLPSDMQAIMVVVGVESGYPVFLKQKLQIKPSMNLVANPVPATLKQISKEVASI